MSVAVSPRAVALEILGRVRTGRVTVADALAAPGAEALDERDRAFLQELVLGTLRRRGWLDYVLSGLSSRPIGTLTPGVLDALRLGAYQLLYLRVADHAAVSESVELARAAEPRSAGFANAVLRRLQHGGTATGPWSSAGRPTMTTMPATARYAPTAATWWSTSASAMRAPPARCAFTAS